MTRLLVLLLCLVLLAWGVTIAQGRSGENTALSLRSNVVKITTHLSSEENGFGFVVGETSGKLYIVTANHVVRDVTGADQKPRVTFYQDPGKTYVGELLATHLTSEQGDIAILRITTPQGFTWKRDAISREAARRDVDVWFIGRSGDWYVPTRSAAVNKIEPTGTILVDGLPIASGTSGAPLMSETGIIGLIIRHDGTGYSEATPVDVIKRAMDDWHYPWQLVPARIERIATAMPVRTDSLSGTWSGPVVQPGYRRYSVKMVLVGSRGSIDYPELLCGGTLSSIGPDEFGGFLYRERITYGNGTCLDGGTVRVVPNGSSIDWRWWLGNTVVAGTLTRK